MKIISSEFVISNTDVKKCPPETMPEYAFIGRSNVGKSSLINMLTGKKDLAKTSSTPGKTQLINHFLINNEWYIVDLPGYGFAKPNLSVVESWKKFTIKYFLSRENLMCTFVLIDVRHEPQKKDVEFMEFMAENSLPFVMVFTKADKLSAGAVKRNIENYFKEMKKTWAELPKYFVTSALKKSGSQEILDYIEEVNKLWK
ncbi:MAG: YihA family ribosome biogenesis GTP-binding protein [Bacteroidales bacterium]|nr:YihA family ribosome biogenesis GTP-binding protein [Bacteroidales bacterium]MBQ5539463.1 YihA family ribosome biogenesis GTP-binding protein [Bacteroidales bacterium]MBR4678164.1 YihA family ribosome biogenesis GTP-binding protein [Bacteroidales bacterium]